MFGYCSQWGRSCVCAGTERGGTELLDGRLLCRGQSDRNRDSCRVKAKKRPRLSAEGRDQGNEADEGVRSLAAG